MKMFVLTTAIGLALLSSSADAMPENDIISGYCDGPDTRVCKITEEGSTAMGDWVETKIKEN